MSLPDVGEGRATLRDMVYLSSKAGARFTMFLSFVMNALEKLDQCDALVLIQSEPRAETLSEACGVIPAEGRRRF